MKTLAAAWERATWVCANAVLTWAARRVDPGRRSWIEALRGELGVVNGGAARLRWALGGVRFVVMARRNALTRPWYSPPSLLRVSAFGLGLGAVMVVAIVWSNVIMPSHESDDEYTGWYLAFYAGLLVYLFLSGFLGGRAPGLIVSGAWTGAVTGVLIAVIVLVTFFVIDNAFLDVVMQQPDKAAGFQRSGLSSARDYVNQGMYMGLATVLPTIAVVGAGLGSLGGMVRKVLARRRPSV